MMSITNTELDQIFQFWRGSSTGPAHVFQLPAEVDPVAWFRGCLSESDSKTVYGVALGLPEDIERGEYKTLAITSNGPGSLTGAQFYVMCHWFIPKLIYEILRLRIELVTLKEHAL